MNTKRDLERRIFDQAHALVPSAEMPSLVLKEPPLSAEVEALIADVMLFQAATASSITWSSDAQGAAQRARLIHSLEDWKVRAGPLGLFDSSEAFDSLLSDMRAWSDAPKGALKGSAWSRVVQSLKWRRRS